jgi:hypothetical protein
MHGPAIPAAPAPALAPVQLSREEIDRRNAIKIGARRVILEKLSTPTIRSILVYSESIIKLWIKLRIPGLDCAKAYYILNYTSFNAGDKIPAIVQLLKSVASICLVLKDNISLSEIPIVERRELFESLRTSLIPFGEISLLTDIPREDKHYSIIRKGYWDNQERIRQEERQEAEERQRQLAINLRENPVIFKRDPEGSIDLAAFATDTQNIHRSSVQTSTQKAVLQLMTRSVDPDQETLIEVIKDLEDPKKIRIVGVTRERLIMELQHDYYECIAFSISYGEVLDRVWTFIRSHKSRNDIFIRLAQEIAEGIGMCTNGKMARLVNVLQGYDDTLCIDPPKEIFHEKMAQLMKVPKAERVDAAHILFIEFSILESDQKPWLDLLEEN